LDDKQERRSRLLLPHEGSSLGRLAARGAGWRLDLGPGWQVRQPLFAAIGTTYGGDGETTFALPDLRDRATAGADARRDQPVGATSGLDQLPRAVLPHAVVRWAIAVQGEFPDRR